MWMAGAEAVYLENENENGALFSRELFQSYLWESTAHAYTHTNTAIQFKFTTHLWDPKIWQFVEINILGRAFCTVLLHILVAYVYNSL